MKKLINLIFAEKQQEQTQQQQPAWSFERNGWEASAKHYNAQHGLKDTTI